MNIHYISLGSFCYPKMLIRETNRLIGESLPFDFNSSPNLSNIGIILKELYENKNYDIELEEVLTVYNENELCVSEKNKMFLVHFFKDYDLITEVNNYPVSANLLKPDIVNEVKKKFKKRFERLYDILNDEKNIICFLRIENYENPFWKVDLEFITEILDLFNNKNKFLIYSQINIDDELDFKNSKKLNYDYKIPIFYNKFMFYDKIMIEKKELFINLLENFEYILNFPLILNICNIDNKNIIEKFYMDNEYEKLFKLTDIKICYQFSLIDNLLIIFDDKEDNIKKKIYTKNENNIYEIKE